ncbi:unnamed protein product [Hydatigera taeniaeformis]|uniref:Autophagy-related protein 2 n=1 Tax=Hydatigena taeniaeformis TaxID=6205 RepID=A0A0R3X5M0_HYDTA|nr:unnamed protein product [Hydatigera taeniaeformis]
MAFWNATQHSPLESNQLQLLGDKIVCSDVYLNIERLNVTLAEQNIPLAICVAYVGQLAVHLLSGKLEFIDLEVVVQTTLHNFSSQNDGMFNSLISSVTALAFAAASVADGDTVVEPPAADSQCVEKIVQKVDTLMRNLGNADSTAPSLVDDVVIERAARLIDILFLGATVVLRDLRLRVQCPLALNGAHRVCDLRLQIQILEITNGEGTDVESAQSSSSSTTIPTSVTSPHHEHRRECPKTLPKPTSPAAVENKGGGGNLWSWFWSKTWIFGLGSTSLKSPANGGAEGSLGSSPFAQKLFRFEGATLHWDLWDTSIGQTSPLLSSSSTKSTSVSSPSTSIHDSISLNDGFFSGPEPESMVASACLLSLLGPDNYVALHIRHDSTILSRIISSSAQTSSPTLIDVNVDLGPVVACLCPTQIFWLGAMVTQLTKLFQAYNTVQKARHQVDGNSTPSNMDSSDPKAGPLVDLDISVEDDSMTSIDSNMFRSCLGASSFPFLDEAPPFTDSPPFSVCARCRLFTLTLFHTDEAASFSTTFGPRSISIDSSGGEESFHEAISTTLDSEPAQGTLKNQNDFFATVSGADGGVSGVLAAKRSVGVAQWLENVNAKLAQCTQGRNHLLLSLGFCELEGSPFIKQMVELGEDTGRETIFPPRGLLTCRVEGLLLSESLFSQDGSSPPHIVNGLLKYDTIINATEPSIPGSVAFTAVGKEYSLRLLFGKWEFYKCRFRTPTVADIQPTPFFEAFISS